MATQQYTAEVWKPVVGYEDWYSVSDQGNIRSERTRTNSKRGRIIRPATAPNGYLLVTLCKGGRVTQMSVHRIVATAFFGGPECGRQVNHKNGIKSDNRADNLEWVTPKENSLHARRTLGHNQSGEKHANAILTWKKVRSIRAMALAKEMNQQQIAAHFGVDHTTISNITTGRAWKQEVVQQGESA